MTVAVPSEQLLLSALTSELREQPVFGDLFKWIVQSLLNIEGFVDLAVWALLAGAKTPLGRHRFAPMVNRAFSRQLAVVFVEKPLS